MKKTFFLALLLSVAHASAWAAEEAIPLVIVTQSHPHTEAIQRGEITIPECRISYSTKTLLEIKQSLEEKSAGDVLEVDMMAYLKWFASQEKHEWTLVPVFLLRSFPDKPIEELKTEFEQTRVFPIRTALAVRAELVNANPWLPEALFLAFSEAKQKAIGAGSIPRPLGEQTVEIMGKNYWSYGVKYNPKSLTALFKAAHEQGLTPKELSASDVFSAETLQLLDEKGAKN